MTSEELKQARKTIAPNLTQDAFAQALGYEGTSSYRRYESGGRPVPVLLEKLITLLVAAPDMLGLIDQRPE